jgi:hypothetical protein
MGVLTKGLKTHKLATNLDGSPTATFANPLEDEDMWDVE